VSAEGAREGSGRLHVQEVSDQIQRVNRHFFAGAATSCLVSFAKDQALPLLFLAAGISIVLGVGIPTIAVYVLLASLVAPALTRLGIEPIAVHLFVLIWA